MAKVSVIVPVYNVEQYLSRCLNSILNQTLQDIEIILVDDGATDRSGEICDDYEKKDDRIKVIHKPNGGLSDARNTGAKMATSEYLIFIDSDDYIAENMIEKLYEMVQGNHADFSACGVYNVYVNGATPQCNVIEEFVCSNQEAFAHILVGQKIPGTICNKLIKREIANTLQFPVGRLYEDAFYTTQLMQKVQTVAVTTEPMYYYCHREGSITTTPFRKKDMDVVAAYETNLEIVKEKYPDIVEQAEFRLEWAYFTVLDRILLLEKYREVEEFGKVVKFLRKNMKSILTSKYFYKSRKIGALVLAFNVKFYEFLVKYRNKKSTGLL